MGEALRVLQIRPRFTGSGPTSNQIVLVSTRPTASHARNALARLTSSRACLARYIGGNIPFSLIIVPAMSVDATGIVGCAKLSAFALDSKSCKMGSTWENETHM